MLIDIPMLVAKHNCDVRGVVHVGAHEAQEIQPYILAGFPVAYWIEADPQVYNRLLNVVKRRENAAIKSVCIEAVVSDTVGERVKFNRASLDMSSSLLELGTHAQQHPEVTYVDSFEATTTTLDQLTSEYPFMAECNFLNLDIQGAEMKAVQGGSNFLEGIDYIYTEVNQEELYVGCTLLPEFDAALEEKGFYRVALDMTKFGWGDAFYVRL